MTTEKPCSDHPDAPHGFVRNASHSVGHYVCECSGWTPPDPKSLQERLRDGADICYARNIQLDYARVATEAADRIDALEAQVAALTKDAERYQWLKRSDWVRWDGPDDGVGWTLDQAIDAAIEARKEQS